MKDKENNVAYVIMRNLYKHSNIPKMYHRDIPLQAGKDDIEVFKKLQDFKMNVKEKVSNGEGLYIWGRTTGNGKTTWAGKIVNQYFRRSIADTGIEFEGVYINVPTFMENLRQSYGKEDIEFNYLMEKVYKSKIAIFDDIGSERPSEWVRERLYTIINHRVSNGLTTIYTSNVDLNELEARLGSRICSRIAGSCEVLEIVGQDRRVMKGEK